MNYKIELSSEEVPKKWYNINADLPCELPMPKNSEGRNQIEDLQKAFPPRVEMLCSQKEYLQII